MEIGDDHPLDQIMTRQPKYAASFRCIGSNCEDTCCEGSTVVVDKATFEKYRACPDRQLKVLMDEVIATNPVSQHDATFSYVVHSDGSCPFLDEHKLCGIQNKLGESYLSRTCYTYPRAINTIDDITHKTLYLSCPAAARLALLDPNAMQWVESECAPMPFGDFPSVDTSAMAPSNKPYQHLTAIQEFIEALITNREHQMWERLAILGMYCEQLDSMRSGETDDVLAHIVSYESHISADGFRPVMDGVECHPEIQLNFAITALEHRLTSHAAGIRFIECFREFTEGIGYTSDSPGDATKLYANAYDSYYKPFIDNNQHILENYLINYIRTTLFPLGPQKGVYIEDVSIFDSYLMLIITYSLMKSMLVGISAYYKKDFGANQIIKLIQTFTKAIEHNPAYKKEILRSFRDNGMDKMGIIAVLLKN